jgi:hypothetical protein
MKRFVFLLLAVSIGAAAIATATSKAPKNHRSLSSAQQITRNEIDEPGVINGSKHPEMIPDHVAYTLLFRLIANRRTEVEQKRILAYIQQMIFGEGSSSDADVNALVAAAEEFQQRVGVLDLQAEEIKDHNQGDQSSVKIAQLKRLQRQKEAIIDEIVASLPGRLSKTGVEHVRWHVSEHVKRNAKLHVASTVQ